MATSETTVRFLLDQLSNLPSVRARKMFGEYALHFGEKVVALVCDDHLFVEITVPGKAANITRRDSRIQEQRRRFCVGPDEEPDDHERLATLIRVTAAALPSPKPKRAHARGQKNRRAEKIASVLADPGDLVCHIP